MTIAHSARKIIKTQRFIFRALPALLVSVFVLNACSGAVPVTVNNSSDSNEEIAKLKQDATTADNRITELEEASRRAGIAKTTADNDIIRLKNEAVQAGIAKASADSEIIILQGQLATAIGERGTANGMITILQGQLETANNNQNPDDSATVTRLRSQLLMAINDKNAADMRITTLEGQLSTAMGNEQTASNRITELEDAIQKANEQAQALRRVEYANWEAGKTPDASPDTANPRHQFLQNRNRTLDTGTTTHSATSSDAPTILTFDSSDFRFDGRPVSLDTNDGFATFTGYHSDGTNYGYIGLLDTTDFGAPLAQTSTALIWNGSFLHESTYTDFALTINVQEMGNGDIDAFFKFGKEVDYNILLTGGFDANGVITAQGMGSVFTGNDRDFPTGTASEFSITGLIGADGALGIFSNENVGVGGFFVTPTAVPDPNVGYSKWVKALDLDIIPDTENPRDQYLLIRDGKFNTGTTTDSPSTNGTPQLLPRFTFNTTDFEYDGRPVGTDTNDGFTGFLGYHSDGTDRAYFSILDTTDLGAPLSPTSTSLEWNGSFLYGSARPTRADFTLTIDVKETGDGTIDAFLS